MSNRPRALITGITGQDGSYLADLLLNEIDTPYDVYGFIRRSAVGSNALSNIKHLTGHPNLKLLYGDLTDTASINRVLTETKPSEIYNLGAQSHVRISFDTPVSTGDINALGTMRLLEAVRTMGYVPHTKFYQASTSELFGKVVEIPQTELTPFNPRSPYGVAKLYAYWAVRNYREAYDLFGCNGILFNHESPRRGYDFVTRKVTKYVADYITWTLNKPLSGPVSLKLGNLSSNRDWGHAKDYVRGMWSMLQQDDPDDYVLASGRTHTIRELVETAFNYANETIRWEGSNEDEKGYTKAGDLVVEVEPEFYRPAEVDFLLGSPKKAIRNLNWVREYSFKDLIWEMIESDLS